MEKYENKDICASCGGYCCKKCGCDYFVSDFESLKYDYLNEVLQTGKVSIVAALNFKRTEKNAVVVKPKLYLRERNLNREIIDLLSMKTTCASLQEAGCYYDLEHRPSGGACLIPSLEEPCYSEVNRLEELNKWNAHQQVLRKLVKQYTGKTVNEKLSEDVENLFYNIFMKNFEGVSDLEKLDIKKMLPLLGEVFPEQIKTAHARFLNDLPVVLNRIKNENN